MIGDFASEPDDFDPFAGFMGGVDPVVPEPAGLFDDLGALEFGPSGGEGLDDPGLTWYDAPHSW
jgi:hypothetical protein